MKCECVKDEGKHSSSAGSRAEDCKGENGRECGVPGVRWRQQCKHRKEDESCLFNLALYKHDKKAF